VDPGLIVGVAGLIFAAWQWCAAKDTAKEIDRLSSRFAAALSVMEGVSGYDEQRERISKEARVKLHRERERILEAVLKRERVPSLGGVARAVIGVTEATDDNYDVILEVRADSIHSLTCKNKAQQVQGSQGDAAKDAATKDTSLPPENGDCHDS